MVLSQQGNYRAYRTVIANQVPPFIPLQAVILKDLTAIEEHQTFLKESEKSSDTQEDLEPTYNNKTNLTDEFEVDEAPLSSRSSTGDAESDGDLSHVLDELVCEPRPQFLKTHIPKLSLEPLPKENNSPRLISSGRKRGQVDVPPLPSPPSKQHINWGKLNNLGKGMYIRSSLKSKIFLVLEEIRRALLVPYNLRDNPSIQHFLQYQYQYVSMPEEVIYNYQVQDESSNPSSNSGYNPIGLPSSASISSAFKNYPFGNTKKKNLRNNEKKRNKLMRMNSGENSPVNSSTNSSPSSSSSIPGTPLRSTPPSSTYYPLMVGESTLVGESPQSLSSSSTSSSASIPVPSQSRKKSMVLALSRIANKSQKSTELPNSPGSSATLNSPSSTAPSPALPSSPSSDSKSSPVKKSVVTISSPRLIKSSLTSTVSSVSPQELGVADRELSPGSSPSTSPFLSPTAKNQGDQFNVPHYPSYKGGSFPPKSALSAKGLDPRVPDDPNSGDDNKGTKVIKPGVFSGVVATPRITHRANLSSSPNSKSVRRHLELNKDMDKENSFPLPPSLAEGSLPKQCEPPSPLQRDSEELMEEEAYEEEEDPEEWIDRLMNTYTNLTTTKSVNVNQQMDGGAEKVYTELLSDIKCVGEDWWPLSPVDTSFLSSPHLQRPIRANRMARQGSNQ